jgi:putative transposase
MDAALTEKAVAAAVAQCGSLAEIFNTDQGSQFTSPEWTGRLEGLGIAVSMDGKDFYLFWVITGALTLRLGVTASP